MSEQQYDLREQLAELKGRLDTLSAQLQKAPKKGLLEILASLSPLLSGVLIAGVATFATITYNERQVQLAQLNALDKYRVYLTSENPQDREFGYQAFVALGQEEFVIRLIGTRRDGAGANVLASLAETAQDATTRRAAQNTLLSLPQERRVRALVNIFDTGSPESAYDRVLTPGNDVIYGDAMTTLTSGNLFYLIKDYTEREGAQYRTRFLKYLGRLEIKDRNLAEDESFLALLRAAGNDPVMKDVQENYFKRIYFARAYSEAERIGVKTPLGIAVVFDSIVHGGWARLRDQTQQQLHGVPATGIDEEFWIKTYLQLRRQWFASHQNELLRTLTWRPEALLELAEGGNWELLPPIRIRGSQIVE